MGKHKRKPNKRLSNRDLAKIIGLTACLNIIIALGALALGIWIDKQMAWQGVATVTLIAVSFPLSIYLMIRVALMLFRKWNKAVDSQVVDHLPQEEED